MVIFLLVLQRRYPDSRGMFFGVTERGITGLRGDLSVLKKNKFLSQSGAPKISPPGSELNWKVQRRDDFFGEPNTGNELKCKPWTGKVTFCCTKIVTSECSFEDLSSYRVHCRIYQLGRDLGLAYIVLIPWSQSSETLKFYKHSC